MLKKLYTNSEELNRVQDNVESELRRIEATVILAGRFVTVELLASSTDNRIAHGLKRKIQGFIPVRKDAQADIWESPTNNAFLERFILLRASNAVTATLYVF